jgi:hypothetical protein
MLTLGGRLHARVPSHPVVDRFHEGLRKYQESDYETAP